MATLKRPAWAKYSLMFLSTDMACSSDGEWVESCFWALNTGTVRVTTSNARYQLLFFILKLLYWGPHSDRLSKIAPKTCCALSRCKYYVKRKQIFLLHLSGIECLFSPV